eukprot:scaffold11822_cov120-Isochrysis_galbana.AAC.4
MQTLHVEIQCDNREQEGVLECLNPVWVVVYVVRAAAAGGSSTSGAGRFQDLVKPALRGLKICWDGSLARHAPLARRQGSHKRATSSERRDQHQQSVAVAPSGATGPHIERAALHLHSATLEVLARSRSVHSWADGGCLALCLPWLHGPWSPTRRLRA